VENQPAGNLKASLIVLKKNQIAVKKMVSPVVGNVSLVAIRRNPAKKVNVKNRRSAQRKILRAKKEKNPVPIKKRTVLR